MDGPGLRVAQVACAAFLSVVFLQSGTDKVIDWAGNRAYFAGVFEKTPVRRLVPLLLLSITLLELLAGTLSGAGVVALVLTRSTEFAFGGALVACATVLALFSGLRLAKDYAGAAGLTGYFLITVVAVLVLGSR